MRDKLQKAVIASTAGLALLTPALAQVEYSYSSSSSDGGGAFVLAMWCCMCVFGLLAIGIQIYLIIDAVGRDYGEENNMLAVSLIILLLLGFPIGSILYYFLVMNKYPKKSGSKKSTKAMEGEEVK